MMSTGDEEQNNQAIDEHHESTNPTSVDAGTSSPSRVVSLKKREANRRNAQHSTGPRTPEGKEKVRWNALKHGLLAKAIATNLPSMQESAAEFQQLLTSLHDELQPVGLLEELCVERLAAAYWRLRRVLRTETMHLSQACETAKEEARQAVGAANQDAQDAEEAARQEYVDCGEALRLLREIKKELHDQRDGPEETCKETCNKIEQVSILVMNDRVDDLYRAAVGSRQTLTGQAPATKEELIREARTAYQEVKNHRAELEVEMHTAAAEAEANRHKPLRVRVRPDRELPKIMVALPDALGALPRYETMFNREIDRAMDRLMKLQRERLKASTPSTTPSTQLHRAG
jgi:hypothetical protein